MSNPLNGERLTKNERREQAREQARLQREEQKKKDRRNKILLQGGIILGVLGVAALIVVLILGSIRPAGPGPQNMASGGIHFTEGLQVTRTGALPAGADPVPTPRSDAGVLDIQVYVDYHCPFCGMFEENNQDYIVSLVDSGAATLEIIPVAILDRVSMGTRYSTRAANAAACVADTAPGSFLDFSALLFANQPPEPDPGLDDGELIALAEQAGATGPEVADCVNSKKFQGFVTAITTAVGNNPDLAHPTTGRFSTPTILVNGQRYLGALDDPQSFRLFLAQVAGEAFVEEETSNSTAEPTPSPTETPTPTPTP